MGLFGTLAQIVTAAFNVSEARDVVKQGLQEALSTMENMVGNPGQETVYKRYVEPEFQQNAQADINDGWSDVDIGEYMDFMGEIVGEGNQIMAAAYEEAQQILSEIEEYLEAESNKE